MAAEKGVGAGEVVVGCRLLLLPLERTDMAYVKTLCGHHCTHENMSDGNCILIQAD